MPKRFLPLCLSPLVLAFGCSKFVPVEGTVTLDGKPLDRASVAFVPEGGGRPSVATTDENGHFRLMTNNKPGDGAAPGKYKVTVNKVAIGERPAPPPAAPDEKKSPPIASFQIEAPRRPLVPAIYMNLSTTPLQFDVPAAGVLDLEIKLSSDADKARAR